MAHRQVPAVAEPKVGLARVENPNLKGAMTCVT
jgi:hypothetical protein